MSYIKELIESKENLEAIIESTENRLEQVEYELYQELLKHHLVQCESCNSYNVTYVYPFTCDKCQKIND